MKEMVTFGWRLLFFLIILKYLLFILSKNKSATTITINAYCGGDNKMKSKKYHIVGTIPKGNIKIIERGKIDTPDTHLYDRILSWLGTGTSIKGRRIDKNVDI